MSKVANNIAVVKCVQRLRSPPGVQSLATWEAAGWTRLLNIYTTMIEVSQSLNSYSLSTYITLAVPFFTAFTITLAATTSPHYCSRNPITPAVPFPLTPAVPFPSHQLPPSLTPALYSSYSCPSPTSFTPDAPSSLLLWSILNIWDTIDLITALDRVWKREWAVSFPH